MLYVIRHGTAEPSSAQGDFARRLTEQGLQDLKASTFGLARLGIRFDHLLHSPLVRAAQTALTLEALSNHPPQETSGLAQPPDEAFLSEVRGFEGDVALVGHLPWVAEMVAWLTLGRPADSPALIFSPGTVAALEGEIEPGRMRLSGLWQPGDLA